MELLRYDPKAAWQKILEDVEFTTETPEGEPRRIFRELLDQLPEVIGDQMDLPVTAASLMESKLRVVRHFVATNFIERFIRSIPDDDPRFQIFSRDAMVDMVSGTFPMLLEMLEGMMTDMPGFLAAQGINDDTFLGHPRGGALDAQAMQAYRAGTLTIGGLITHQPKAMIDFKPKS